MRILFYDTETQGLPLFDQPSSDPRQPHIVQAAAVLVDAGTRTAISSINLISRPDGWEIPEEVARVHGITTEHAKRVGIAEGAIVEALYALWQTADLRVGHNESFDARILRIALKRFMGDEAADVWKAGEAECTQKLATPIIKLPPTANMLAAGRRHYKAPNLSEAYWHFTGRKLENAHSALADVKACMAVYWAIKGEAGPAERQEAPAPAPAPAADSDDIIPFL